MSVGRYVSLATRVWQDEKFRGLNEDAKLLFLYLISSPHGNMVGLYFLPMGYVSHDFGWSLQKTRKVFDVLCKNKMVERDGDVVFVNNFVKYNPIRGPKQAVGAANRLKEMPHNKLIPKFLEVLENHASESDYFSFVEVYGIGYQYPIDNVSIPESESETETESDTESEKEVAPPPVEIAEKFAHLNINREEHEKLVEVYGEEKVREIYLDIKNYAGNKKYTSLYLTARKWLKNDKERGGGGAKAADVKDNPHRTKFHLTESRMKDYTNEQLEEILQAKKRAHHEARRKKAEQKEEEGVQ